MNTPGGGLSFNHPGMFATPLSIESVLQLRGECAECQVDNPKNCLLRAGEFILSSNIVMLLRVE